MTEEETLNDDEEEMVEVEVTEISLCEEDIDDLIEKLQELKQTKTEVGFEMDDENEFLFKFDEGQEEDDGEEEGEE